MKSELVDLEFQIESVLDCFGGFFNMICYVFQCGALFRHGQRVSGDRCNLGRIFRSESGSRVFRASLTKCGRTKRPEVKEIRKQMWELSQLFGTKPEKRLAVMILVGSLVPPVGVPILSHLAVRRPDFP